MAARRKERGVIPRHRERIDEQIGLGRIAHPLGGAHHGDAAKAEEERPLSPGIGIRPADEVAAFKEHSGKRAHPHAANAEKMHPPHAGKEAG